MRQNLNKHRRPAFSSCAEQFRMGAGTHKVDCIALDLVDQQKVAADMGF